ncbi:MAG: helix-turn-helix domain-containing protein [Bacteroidota bacterium]
MKVDFRCDCPITSALDILGDKWTLVIIKQMLLEDKQTFKQFLESDEAIATNILSARLKMLEELKILTKGKLPNNRKMNIYRLTEKGLALTPIIIELALWSDAHIRELHAVLRMDSSLEVMKNNKAAFIETVQENYRQKINESFKTS